MFHLNDLASVKLIAFDFDGVFTDNFVCISQDGTESVKCNRSDGIGLTRLASLGVKFYIISSETNPVVKKRAEKLKIPVAYGVEKKNLLIQQICKDYGMDLKSVLFVGNDINDIPAFKIVGIPIGVADSNPEIFPHIVYKTSKPGGHGAVREICDLVFYEKMKFTPNVR